MSSKNLLFDEYPLMVSPTLANIIGLNEAIFLQQVNYWITKSRHRYDGRTWIYNTFDGWKEQFPFWSLATIKRTVANLRESGLLVTTSQYNKLPMDRTLWYTIDRDVFDKLVGALPSCQIATMGVAECDDGKLQSDTSNNQRLTQRLTTDVAATAAQPEAAPQPAATKEPTEHQQYFAKVCEIVGWDYRTITKEQKGQVAQTVGILRDAKYTYDELCRFGKEVWVNDWRWIKLKQHPTLSQLRAEIGKLRNGEYTEASKPPAPEPITLPPAAQRLRDMAARAANGLQPQ